MKTADCDHVRDVAAELALDALPGDERAAALEHLDECAGCRALVDELSRAADDLLTALPSADLPEELRDRLHRDARAATTIGQGRRAWTYLAAAAVVVVVLAGVVIAGVRSATAPDDGVHHAALVGLDAGTTGDVEITSGEPQFITMRIEDAGDAVYRCVITLDDGGRVDIGYLPVTDGSGEWTGVLDHPFEHIVTAEVIDETGTAIATATFDHTR